jgi:hypothetical protein
MVAIESRCGAAASFQEPDDMSEEVRNGLLIAAAFRAYQQELRQRSRALHQRTDQNPAPCKRSRNSNYSIASLGGLVLA